MHLQFIVNAVNQAEAKVLSAIASFSADAIDATQPAKPEPVAVKAPSAMETPAAPKKSPGRPKKAVEPEPVIEDELEESADEITDDDLEDLDGESDTDSEDADDFVDEEPVPTKKSKAAPVAPEKKKAAITQKQIIDAFKVFATEKGRDAGVALLKKFNVKSSRELKESEYPAFMKAITK